MARSLCFNTLPLGFDHQESQAKKTDTVQDSA